MTPSTGTTVNGLNAFRPNAAAPVRRVITSVPGDTTAVLSNRFSTSALKERREPSTRNFVHQCDVGVVHVVCAKRTTRSEVIAPVLTWFSTYPEILGRDLSLMARPAFGS